MRTIWDLHNIKNKDISLANIEKWDKSGIKIDDFYNKTNKLQGKIMNDISDFLIENKSEIEYKNLGILYKYGLSNVILNHLESNLDLDVLLLLKNKNIALYNKKTKNLRDVSLEKLNTAISLYLESNDYFDIKNLEIIYEAIEENGSSLTSLINKTSMSSEVISESINKLISNNIAFYTSEGIKKVFYGTTSIMDIMEVVNENIENTSLSYKCISEILKTYNFSKVANELNISSRNVKLMCRPLFDFKILNKNSWLYFNMIHDFNVPYENFFSIFKINVETYNYLKYFYKKIEDNIDDDCKEYNEIAFFQNLNITNKEQYLKVNNLIFENEELVKIKFNEMLRLFITLNKGKIFHIDKLENDFIQFAMERSLKVEKGRNTIAKLERNENLIYSFRKEARYYDYSLIDKDVLNNIENILLNSKGLYSSQYFFDNHTFFKKDLDIRNHYELHNLIKKYFSCFEEKDIFIERMPNILIGYKNKKDFYKQLIFEFAPIKENDFYTFLNSEYGNEINSLRSNLPLLLSKYNVNDEYIVNFTPLTDTQVKDIIQKMLKDNILPDIILIDEMKEIFNHFNIPEEVFNNKNILKLGFKIEKSYIYKEEYTYFTDAINAEMDREELFEKNLFIKYNRSNFVDKMLKDKKIFRFTKNKYITSKKLFSNKFNEILLDELLSVLNNILQELNERFYSIKMIRNEMDEKWDYFGFEDDFLESLLEYVLEWKVIRTANKIFYKEDEILVNPNFIEYLVAEFGSVFNRDLGYYLEDKYFIFIEEDKLEIYLKKCDNIYYNSELKKSFIDKDKYYDELKRFDESKV